jgi:hypothetical protein
MKLKKFFEAEAALSAAISKNPKRELFMVLHRAKRQISEIADKARDANPVPPSVDAYRRDLSAMSMEFNTADNVKKSIMLKDLSEKFPTAKADTVAWSADQDILAESEVEFKFENPAPLSLAFEKELCSIGCENLAVLASAGIFEE